MKKFLQNNDQHYHMLNRYKIYLLLLLSGFIFPHGISESDKVELIHGSLIDYLYLGTKHMVSGYDHILFLIGVIFFLTRYLDIVKFVTAFTVGHSITLIFATLLNITANYYLIDAVIAFSVIYKGFENLGGFKKWLHKNPPNLILMVFVFGLIHGFGLSTRLQQINLGDHNLIYSILSFNVGVELGQVIVLLIVFPLLLMIRGDSFKKLSKLLNWGLIVLGILLLMYQLNGYFTFEDNHDYEVQNTQMGGIDQHDHHVEDHKHSHENDDKDHTHDGHHHDHDK